MTRKHLDCVKKSPHLALWQGLLFHLPWCRRERAETWDFPPCFPASFNKGEYSLDKNIEILRGWRTKSYFSYMRNDVLLWLNISALFISHCSVTVWMRSSRVVRASDSQCRSRNCPGFDPSILRHSGIWGETDEAVLNIEYWTDPKLWQRKIIVQSISQHYLASTFQHSFH